MGRAAAGERPASWCSSTSRSCASCSRATRRRSSRAGAATSCACPPDSVDALRFERLVTTASAASGDARREALALWRGPPLDDLADEPFAAAEIRRLEELWLRARELVIDDALAAGEHARRRRASSRSWCRRTRCASGCARS